MAKRPVFVISNKHIEYSTHDVEFQWFPGYAISQKQKSIRSLHDSAYQKYNLNNILEISSKSELELGVKLSAFNIKIRHQDFGFIPLECAFQGSKVFQKVGQVKDFYKMDPYKIKKDSRLKESGPIIGFNFNNVDFDNKPITFFYNWIYINAVYQNQRLSQDLLKFDAFTDIEFNPKRSINCQAKACALYVTLSKTNNLERCVTDINFFKNIMLSISKKDRSGYFDQQFKLDI